LKNVSNFLNYNSNTGEFIWVKPRSLRLKPGDKAGYINPEGYVEIRFNYKKIKAHRLAWFIYYGKWPKHFIDHINGNPSDNRIKNLREVSSRENSMNQKSHRKRETCRGLYFIREIKDGKQVLGKKVGLNF
jgi:hypothetical protein